MRVAKMAISWSAVCHRFEIQMSLLDCVMCTESGRSASTEGECVVKALLQRPVCGQTGLACTRVVRSEYEVNLQIEN